MYWIPIFFIFCELLYISNIDSLNRYANCKILLDKFKDKNLENYIKKEFASSSKIFIFISVFLFFELIYFLVGFFYPIIWIMSSLFIIQYIILTIGGKIKKQNSIEKAIKLANLKNFESSDIKFERLLKLNELKQRKTYNWFGYIYSTIRIIAFIAIIVLHYNYKIL